MTSLRPTYVPHGLLTTHYSLLHKAPLLKSLAIGLWTLSLSGNLLRWQFIPQGLLTTHYSLLTKNHAFHLLRCSRPALLP